MTLFDVSETVSAWFSTDGGSLPVTFTIVGCCVLPNFCRHSCDELMLVSLMRMSGPLWMPDVFGLVAIVFVFDVPILLLPLTPVLGVLPRCSFRGNF